MLTVMRAAFFGAFGTVVVAATPSLAQETTPQNDDILKMFDRFVVTEIIGTRCGNFEEDLVQKYQANFMRVMPAAMKRLEEMRPEMSKQQVGQVLDGRRKMLRDGITRQLDELGCEDSSFKKVLTLYRVHAEWDPGQ